MVHSISQYEYVAYAEALKGMRQGESKTDIHMINHVHEKLKHAQSSEVSRIGWSQKIVFGFGSAMPCKRHPGWNTHLTAS